RSGTENQACGRSIGRRNVGLGQLARNTRGGTRRPGRVTYQADKMVLAEPPGIRWDFRNGARLYRTNYMKTVVKEAAAKRQLELSLLAAPIILLDPNTYLGT